MKSLRTLWPYLLRYRGQLAVGTVFLALTNLVTLAGPAVIGRVIDRLTRSVTALQLGQLALWTVGIALVAGTFRYFMRQILIGVSRRVEYDLRNELFAHLERQPATYFHANPTGDLMSRATSDMEAVRMLLGPGIMQGVNTVVIAVGAIAIMLYISPLLTLVALLPMPLLSISVAYFGQRIHAGFEVVQAQFARLSAMAQENLSGVRVVRAYAQEAAQTARFDQLNREYVAKNQALIQISSSFFPAIGFLAALGPVILISLGGWLVLQHRITLGGFVAFSQYLLYLTWPMIALGWVVNLFQRGAASWSRIRAILTTVPTIADRPGATAPVNGRGRIEVRDLTFTYPGAGRPALSDVSLTVEAGQTIALVGHTGSGKTTLLALLLRLHEPPPGTVFIDGREVDSYTLSGLRRLYGVVPQETFLFSTTVAGNIAFGVEHATDEDVRWAARVAHLDVDVAGFPGGFETVVGERGITLSGGQKQRTAIARAVLRRPTILVLDDCLSSVDAVTEEGILRELKDVMRDRTSIVVSHRASTVRHADRIYVLEEGRVVEQGAHAELMARDGAYAELVRRQQLEEELEAS